MTITFISEPNKHIEDYLDYYFDGKKDFQYALLLNGAWGSGKTWFVKKYLEKKEDQGRQICYVSLNGLSKTSDIDESIFKSIHPILGSKGARLVGQLGKGLLKATLKVDLDGDSKPDASVNASLPTLRLPDYLKIGDNFILVFDDLERCEIKKEEVLGYINYFVEQEKIKTLIVSNEKEIKDNHEYARKKEKIIGATFNYTEDQDLAIQSILEEVEKDGLKSLLNSNLELIKQTFNQVAYKNLRSFKQAIFDFERFYKKDYFVLKGNFDNEIFEKILKAFLILSLENKKGRFDKEILNFKLDQNNDSSRKPEDKIADAISGFEGDDAHEFKKKYQMSLNDYIFSKKLWNQILNKNIITDALIETELYEAYFRLKEDKPIWLKLWNFLDLEEDEFDTLVKKATESIENGELNHTGDILHTISMLIYFEEKKLIDFSIDPLISRAILQSKELFNITERMKKIEDFSFGEFSGNHGFFASKIPKFQNFIDEVLKAYEEKYNERNTERKIELLALMEHDALEFYQCLTNTYSDYPVLKFLDPNEFLSKLCAISHYNSMQVLYALDYRYKVKSLNKIYEKEEAWFEAVIELTRKKLDSLERIKKFELKEKIIPKLMQIKEEAHKG